MKEGMAGPKRRGGGLNICRSQKRTKRRGDINAKRENEGLEKPQEKEWNM